MSEANDILSADEQLIQEEFSNLLNDYLNSNHRRKVERITKAFSPNSLIRCAKGKPS